MTSRRWFILAEAKLKPPVYERPKPFYTLAVLFIAVVIVLSTLSIYFYLRAEDYSDAKYRSQSAIISDMRGRLDALVSDLGDVMDINSSNSWRAYFAEKSYYGLGVLADCADFVMSQYRTYDPQEETFRLLRNTFAALSMTVHDVRYDLSIQPSTGTGYLVNSTLSARIAAWIPLLQNLEDEFSRALGHENVSRYDEHPSSVVDAMDLELIHDIADSLV